MVKWTLCLGQLTPMEVEMFFSTDSKISYLCEECEAAADECVRGFKGSQT